MKRIAFGLILILAAAPVSAQSFDYRTLHLIEDRNTHAIINSSDAPEDGDLPERGRADCARIQALDRQGRNVARAFGRMFQRSSIHIDAILTSRVCRKIEAARMLQIGPVSEEPLLDPFTEELDREARTEALLALLDGLGRGESALLLTHPDNVEALTGERLEVGEGLVFTLPPFGEIEVRGRFSLPPL